MFVSYAFEPNSSNTLRNVLIEMDGLTVALWPKDEAIWNVAMGELNIIKLCAADSRDPSGELCRMRFSIGVGIVVAGRFKCRMLRGTGGDGGYSEATVIDAAICSSLSSEDVCRCDRDGSIGESGAL